jgi:hypothetical protein
MEISPAVRERQCSINDLVPVGLFCSVRKRALAGPNISPSHRRCQLVAISNIPLATEQPALKALRAF